LQPRTAAPTWDSLSPGEKQAWLLDQALDCKRDILTLPMPDRDDDSAEAHRLRSLILAAADSTIEQTIRLQTNQLRPAVADNGIEKIFEERRAAAELEIAPRRGAEQIRRRQDVQAELGLRRAHDADAESFSS
jgi:hypothetical protein